MRAVVAVALLLLLSLAGCTSKGGEPDITPAETGTGSSSASGTATKSGSSTKAASGSGSAAPRPNQAPTAALTAVINGTAVAFNLTGADADGDALSWTLAFGDNSTNATGTALPSTVNHTYAAGGFVARLRVFDGTAAAESNVTVNVTGPAVAGAPVVLTGHILVPDPYAQAGGCLLAIFTLLPGFPTEFGASFDVAAYRGWAFAAAPDGISTYLADAAGNDVGGGPSGTLPDDVSTMFTCGTSPDNVDVDYTVTLTPP